MHHTNLDFLTCSFVSTPVDTLTSHTYTTHNSIPNYFLLISAVFHLYFRQFYEHKLTIVLELHVLTTSRKVKQP
jgi:hypothetical protein